MAQVSQVQLIMRRYRLDDLPPRQELPPGYVMRLATHDDVAELGRVLELSFGDAWSEGRVRETLLDDPNVPQTYVIEFGGQIVATASVQLEPHWQPETGTVHYVGADPAHGGKGLGRAVTLETLHAMHALGRKQSRLQTDDFRIPAIKVYFGLGFEPENTDESHWQRWRDLYPKLGIPMEKFRL